MKAEIKRLPTTKAAPSVAQAIAFTKRTFRNALWWFIIQRVVVIIYRSFAQTIGPIFNGQESLDSWLFKMGYIGCPETSVRNCHYSLFNPLTPNDPYRGRTAPLTSKRCILYIYSTNIGTENFKHGIYSLVFSLQNAVCFIILTYLVPVLFTFYIQGVLKLKKIISAPKG